MIATLIAIYLGEPIDVFFRKLTRTKSKKRSVNKRSSKAHKEANPLLLIISSFVLISLFGLYVTYVVYSVASKEAKKMKDDFHSALNSPHKSIVFDDGTEMRPDGSGGIQVISWLSESK